MEGVIAGDTDPPQEMGDDSKKSTEEEQEQVCQVLQQMPGCCSPWLCDAVVGLFYLDLVM